MTEQEKLDFINTYKSNPVKFCEDFYGVELLPYQKIFLNITYNADKARKILFWKNKYGDKNEQNIIR
jgi:hypothetical protein